MTQSKSYTREAIPEAKEQHADVLPDIKKGETSKPVIQTKLTVGAPDDPFEREADAVANKVMRMPAESFIQRKCTHCEEEEKVQRKPLSATITPLIQAKGEGGVAVTDSLRNRISSSHGRGSNLDASTQSFMQSRFGANFSDVKIHTGSEAIQMSRELNAKAFTVGNDIYFNQGQYQPQSDTGKHLLAHELTHTVQQGESAAQQVQRDPDDFVEVDIMTVDPGESEALRQQGITLPSAGIVWSLPSQALTQRIQQVLTAAGHTPSRLNQTPISNPLFVLHDTAIAMGARAIANAARDARGPLGNGAAAFVPSTGAATTTRSDFFDRRRPTATEFEKGNDILALQDRLTNARIIWQNTNASIRTTAMTTALAGLGLTPAQITAETTAAVNQLNAATTSASLVFSTGMWTVNEICNQVAARGAAAVVNNATNLTTLQAAVTIMTPFFATRNQRLQSAVNIEIVQDTGSNCSATGTPLTPYTANVYNNVSMLYLEATLQAGRFPQITTHLLVDRTAGSHCDPRCFNLGLLYSTIAGLLTLPATTSFGITPSYGTSATSNVWWSDPVCGGAHP